MAGFTSVVGRYFAALAAAHEPDEQGWIWLGYGTEDTDGDR